MQFVFIVHSVAVKLNYSTCKRDVSRAVGIPSSGDSGQPMYGIPTASNLVGIPSSGDTVQWGFRPVGIPGTYLFKGILHYLAKFQISWRSFGQF